MENFRKGRVFTTPNGGRCVGCYVEEYDMNGIMEVDYLGIRIMPEGYYNKEVVAKETKLCLGIHEVSDYKDLTRDFEGLLNQIPALYTIHVWNERGGYYSFEGGLDLLNNGRVWEGVTRTEHATVSDALETVKEKLKTDFVIYLEEPMRL